MAVYKEKCPTCGGQIEIKQGETFGICDSCGNTISLSELSKLKSKKYNPPVETTKKSTDDDFEYDSAFDVDESTELSYEELCEKIELALETEEWYIANEYSDEILRRDPKNAYAYLYRLLSDLHLYKKEDLASCGKDFSDYENYRLFSRFADEYILIEINNYLDCNKQKIQEENLEEMYKTACSIFKQASTIKEFSNASCYFSNLKGYKDSDSLLEQCTLSIQNLQTKEKQQKLKKKIIIFSIIGAILLAILIGVVANKNKYDVERIEIAITNVEKKYDPYASPYINGCYYIYFDYEIKNKTGADIDYIEIVTYYTDSSGKSIGTVTTSFGGYYSSTMSLKAKTSQTHETYISENQPEKNQFFTTLYNSDFSDFTVTYKVVSVEFSDGKHYSAN